MLNSAHTHIHAQYIYIYIDVHVNTQVYTKREGGCQTYSKFGGIMFALVLTQLL